MQRAVPVRTVDLAVSQLTGRAPEGFQEFAVPDRNGLTPDRLALELAGVQRVFDPSSKRLLQALQAIDLQQPLQYLQINDPVAFWWLLDFPEAGDLPVPWMRNRPGAHHVQIDIDHAAGQIVVAIDAGGMVTVLPERAAPLFALVVLLARPASDQLHAIGDFLAALVLDQQMHVVGCGDVVEHAQAETLAGLKQPVSPATAVASESQQKFPPMASVRDVPDLARDG